MIDTLYTMLIGSLLVLAIAFLWVVIIAIVIAAVKQFKKR
jgi:hypothetical protein